ncbi:hypothetical protein QBC36DRAFT_336270 [Triangularia setosa]|uniref:DUF7580 domain-containing protein n=1 Tax=Triangularia setosa TaxID=2587417 RepID=A0AAN6W0I4_9PEZI|nr:hypothetical protein QBC36DRAFT_336270 [Podospora setosa]
MEIAGVVLGALPLIVLAGKTFAHDSKSFQQAFRTRYWKDNVILFYEGLWWETVILRHQMQDLVGYLPGISQERKDQLVNYQHIDDWKREDISDSLKQLFPGGYYGEFEAIMRNVVSILGKLLKDDKVPGSHWTDRMLRLKGFQDDRHNDISTSGFLNRFMFLRTAEDRNNYLRRLAKWNKRLMYLLRRATRNDDRRNDISLSTTRAKTIFCPRDLSRMLFTALWRHWKCECDPAHDARFSLACYNLSTPIANRELSFDFLMSQSERDSGNLGWREATVKIMEQRLIEGTFEDRRRVTGVCDEIRTWRQRQQCLVLLVEGPNHEREDEKCATISRLHWSRLTLRPSDISSAISLHTLLHQGSDGRKPGLVERRKLALLLARSILHLHESPFLGRQWKKNNIFFFLDIQTVEPDLQRPYMGTLFEQFPRELETTDLDSEVYHRNAGILNLGVLLIELEEWKSLESLSPPSTDFNNANWGLLAAEEMITKMVACSPDYLAAVEECIFLPWVVQGARASLENEQNQQAMHKVIIERLEREVAALTTTTRS